MKVVKRNISDIYEEEEEDTKLVKYTNWFLQQIQRYLFTSLLVRFKFLVTIDGHFDDFNEFFSAKNYNWFTCI